MVDLLTVYGSSGHGPVRCLMRLILLRRAAVLRGHHCLFASASANYLPQGGSESSVLAAGHLALQFTNKWGCEVHAFTTSDTKEAEAHKLGAHYVHNTRRAGELKKIAVQVSIS